jgi:thiol:disulfide interchange protein DsbC
MNLVRTTFTLLFSVFLATAVQAQAVSFDKAELTRHFAALGVTVQDIQPSTLEGLVEVKTSQGVLFASPDGKQFIAGTLYAQAENGRYVDVLAERQAPVNAAKIEAIKDELIVFKADNEKFVVTVFTDTSCGYCVRLHQQMQGYNDLGITVRYAAYPRQGPQSEPAEHLAQVWCADDQKQAMHNAKLQREFAQNGENIAQCRQLVSEHYQLGRELGITGTPAIFTPGGNLIGGYLPPAKLYQRLSQM